MTGKRNADEDGLLVLRIRKKGKEERAGAADEEKDAVQTTAYA